MKPLSNRIKVSKILHVIVVFIAISGSSLAAMKTYYIDALNGKDSNSGQSSSTAFKTIKKAVDLLMPGDICAVQKGNYPERVNISRSGMVDNYITIRAVETGVTTRGFTIEASFIRIEGFEITGTDAKSWKNGAGIHIRGKNCVIINNYIHNVYLEGIRLGDDLTSSSTSNCLIKFNKMVRCGQAGIQICGQNNIVENNEITGTIQWAKTNPQNLDADGMRFFGSGHIIRMNYIHDILLSDPENSASPHIDCIQTWGPATNIIFEQNNFSLGESKKNKQIAMITEVASPVRDITFRNNFFHDTFRGLNIYGSHVAGHPSPINNVSILNNTFVNFFDNAFELHDCPESYVLNNIFYNSTSIFIDSITSSSSGKLTIGYNCYFRAAGKKVDGINPGKTDLWNVNPGFVNASKGNYNLKNNSPLIGRGKIIPGVKNDFIGRYRNSNKAYDIGAFGHLKNK